MNRYEKLWKNQKFRWMLGILVVGFIVLLMFQCGNS